MNLDQRTPAITLLLMLALVIFGVVFRLAAIAPNFAPIAACALLAGAVIADRRLALLVPLTAMLISDLLIGSYQPQVMIAVYAGLTLPVLLGRYLQHKRSVLRIGGLAALGSVTFFLVSNFAVWAFVGWYPLTADGLASCYASALPFFRNTLAGDLFWSFSLFAAYGLLFESTMADKRELATGTA